MKIDGLVFPPALSTDIKTMFERKKTLIKAQGNVLKILFEPFPDRF